MVFVFSSKFLVCKNIIKCLFSVLLFVQKARSFGGNILVQEDENQELTRS